MPWPEGWSTGRVAGILAALRRPHSPLCTAMTGLWCCVKLESRGESWGDGLLKGDLSISVFFTGDEIPVREGTSLHLWGAENDVTPPPKPRV